MILDKVVDKYLQKSLSIGRMERLTFMCAMGHFSSDNRQKNNDQHNNIEQHQL
jgi:hypothetical protein